MLCSLRQRLVEEYQTAVNAFKDSVLALKDLHGIRFDEAYQTTEERRVTVEKARERWNITSESIDARDPKLRIMHTDT
jgi:hypothetical protein